MLLPPQLLSFLFCRCERAVGEDDGRVLPGFDKSPLLAVWLLEQPQRWVFGPGRHDQAARIRISPGEQCQTCIIIEILKVNHTCVIESDLIPPGSLASGWPDGGAICRVLGQCSDAHSCEAHPATCLGCSQALACGCTALLEGLKPRSSMTFPIDDLPEK